MYKLLIISIIFAFNYGLNATSTWQEVSSTSAITMAQTIHTAPSKGSRSDSDEIGISDSNSSYLFKKINITSLKTFLFGSPSFTGTPTAPTASNGTNTDQIATTSYVMNNGGSGIGVGQTWQDVTSLRSSGTTYINNTGKPIQMAIVAGGANYFQINGNNVAFASNTAASTIQVIIPNGSTYKWLGTFTLWSELR